MDREKERIIAKLKANGCRITKQRMELLDIIRLNDAEACPPQILDHLIANGIFDDKWRRSVSRDIHSVRQGRKDWEWFYTRYKDAPKKYEPCFDDPVVRTVWRAFRKFRKSGGKG